MRTNTKTVGKDHRVNKEVRLAGGYGPYAAKQDAEALLRRSVMACLLWEDNAYENGKSIANNIRELIPQVEPEKAYKIAIEARMRQKLRHTPLFIAREMARIDTHKGYVGDLLPQIIRRADELAEFLAIYWSDDPNQPISSQVKKGLARAFRRFDEYQLAKWNQNRDIKLRDVAFLVHPSPRDVQGPSKTIKPVVKKNYKRGTVTRHPESVLTKLTEGTLATPDTWEVAISACRTDAEKRDQWSRLISDKRLGALAFMRNLRNMEKVGVQSSIIRSGFETIHPGWLLPINYMAAARHAPNWTREIEDLMLRSYSQMDKLPGYTIFVNDVSGSMDAMLSAKSSFSRKDASIAMAIMASEMCEHVAIYATAGNDWQRKHATARVKPVRGFALADEIRRVNRQVGGGGIFTRQCLEYIKSQETEKPDRIIVFSDSQDCDFGNSKKPQPFGHNNYIVDISAHRNGINYDGIWTAEISGWSQHFLNYIMAYEGLSLLDVEEEVQV